MEENEIFLLTIILKSAKIYRNTKNIIIDKLMHERSLYYGILF